MDTLISIHTRQSIGDVRPDPLPRSLIDKLLAAGAQAPNHYKVRPWRFFVITGSGLNRIGDVLAESLTKRNDNLSQEALAKERSKPLRAPLIIVVGVDKPNEPRISEVENICAAAAACQNILLAAQSLGLAAIWRTGPSANDPMVKEFLGMETSQHLVAFLYIGYPVKPPDAPERPDFTDRTIWLDS